MKPSGRAIRPQSVAKLGARILKAMNTGDGTQASVLMKQMIGIAIGGSTEAFRWLAANDGGLLNDFTRQYFWRRPEIVVQIVNNLRQFARATPDRHKKREAEAVLKRYGFDDESLRKEET